MSLSADWLSYELQVLPVNAGHSQRVETRRAFYAGAAALMGAMKAIGETGDDMTEQDVMQLEAIDAELEAFQRDIAAGRA